MNVLFDINHPGHIHFFRHAIKNLEANGHTVIITSRDKDVTIELMNEMKIPYISLTKATSGKFKLGLELFIRECKMLPLLLKYKIDVCASVTGACTVHLGKLLRKPALVFYDTEHAKLQNAITYPFATKIFTPYMYEQDLGKNHVRYKGTQELAYLHPKYFTPNPNIYELLGIPRDQRYALLRFVSWNAAHDIGFKGFSQSLKRKIIETIKPHAKVFIASEYPLEEEFEPYRLPIPVSKIHDALNYADIYVGEGGTMATEAAILGTASFFISPLTAGVFKTLEKDFDLMYSYTPQHEEKILEHIHKTITTPNLKQVWQKKRENFLSQTIDVTEFIIDKILSFEKK